MPVWVVSGGGPTSNTAHALRASHVDTCRPGFGGNSIPEAGHEHRPGSGSKLHEHRPTSGRPDAIVHAMKSDDWTSTVQASDRKRQAKKALEILGGLQS